MWQRHAHLTSPSWHAIRDTCTQLFPLVEMYYKWELQEDCSDLRALMLRFDSEIELEAHDTTRKGGLFSHKLNTNLTPFPDQHTCH